MEHTQSDNRDNQYHSYCHKNQEFNIHKFIKGIAVINHNPGTFTTKLLLIWTTKNRTHQTSDFLIVV